jgi:hypothetical protein
LKDEDRGPARIALPDGVLVGKEVCVSDVGRRPWWWSSGVVGSDSQCMEHERWMTVELVSKVLGEVVTFKGGGAQDLVLHESVGRALARAAARDDSQSM